MDKATYIKSLEEKIADLERRIALLEKRNQELDRRLGMNSQDSSKPPSSDPPGTTTALPRNLRRKKRGARQGHPPHLRDLMPPEAVKDRVELKPRICPCGGTALEKTHDEPLRQRPGRQYFPLVLFQVRRPHPTSGHHF
jgi:transposase